MGTINFTAPADGTTADVADIVTPLNTIYNEFNGNIENANIKAGAAIATSKLADDAGITAAKLATNSVEAAKLATSAITLGYAEKTTNQSITNVATLISGLSSSVTIPAGGRRTKITVYISNIITAINMTLTMSLWDGTVGSGTQLQAYVAVNGNATGSPVYGGATLVWTGTPAAGAKTYNVGINSTSNSGTVVAAATTPAFILVEAI